MPATSASRRAPPRTPACASRARGDRDGVEVYTVVLGCPTTEQRFSDSTALADWYYAHLVTQDAVTTSRTNLMEAPIVATAPGRGLDGQDRRRDHPRRPAADHLLRSGGRALRLAGCRDVRRAASRRATRREPSPSCRMATRSTRSTSWPPKTCPRPVRSNGSWCSSIASSAGVSGQPTQAAGEELIESPRRGCRSPASRRTRA